ncbi:outer membrane beta-barrel protein [Undibacterium sp. RTI2.1]|uniref:outer membrane protein n=1 Tax=unclassified Undibacterium TaxID=2630295 RepID=UPI002AB366DD|nr:MULTISPECIES: outer membrane beta-barrel protein [unclassified Undibacterium]MDY7538860.1 outer membrane beta-barrel protein [Undibacterium sp. 5I1]MEB0030799.1 outer membrane beta-barrel protein [Undibacterium sp. RTI2.1]MEB0117358.1 outer membrane beta-barrel protein [Undibacterium sp. RTI2.2]MEB0230986.1 outer membrane beta-barrel protein [Undibacterium sp. 10I3]MEB0257831.1 outer membrane beta-barrel protein [Undibacterium sp. 5I1]
MFKAKSIFFASIASLLLGTAATSAMAADATTTEAGAYAGLNIAAQAKYDHDCLGSVSCDNKASSSGKIYAGYMGAPSLFEGVNVSQGVELMYYKVGSATETFSSLRRSTSTKGLGASYVLQANFNDFSVNGRLGVAYTDDKSSSTNYLLPVGAVESDQHRFAPLVGVGARYSLTKNISLNADYDRLQSDHTGAVNMFSLGVGYKF